MLRFPNVVISIACDFSDKLFLLSVNRDGETEKGCWRDGRCDEIFGEQNLGFKKRDGYTGCTGWNEVYEGTCFSKCVLCNRVSIWQWQKLESLRAGIAL